MITTTLILNHLHPRNAVDVGRLLLSIENPQQDYYQPKLPTLSEGGISVQRVEDFSTTLHQTKGTRLHAFLSNIFSTSFSAADDSITKVHSPLCMAYQLENCEDFFHAACSLLATRKWLERALRKKRNVYLVSGFKTVTDAQIMQEFGKSIAMEGTAQVPNNLAASAVGVIIPTGNALDVGASMSRTKQSSTEISFHAPGEQVFAIQYRKIKLARFSSEDLDKACLGRGTKWRIYLTARGAEDGVNGGVDARIDDSLQKWDLEEAFESIIIEDEEILYRY